jgi:hypothetical protein
MREHADKRKYLFLTESLGHLARSPQLWGGAMRCQRVKVERNRTTDPTTGRDLHPGEPQFRLESIV